MSVSYTAMAPFFLPEFLWAFLLFSWLLYTYFHEIIFTCVAFVFYMFSMELFLSHIYYLPHFTVFELSYYFFFSNFWEKMLISDLNLPLSINLAICNERIWIPSSLSLN